MESLFFQKNNVGRKKAATEMSVKKTMRGKIQNMLVEGRWEM